MHSNYLVLRVFLLRQSKSSVITPQLKAPEKGTNSFHKKVHYKIICTALLSAHARLVFEVVCHLQRKHQKNICSCSEVDQCRSMNTAYMSSNFERHYSKQDIKPQHKVKSPLKFENK